MLQQQVQLINKIQMILDAMCVVAAGYGAFYIGIVRTEGRWQMDTALFTLSMLAVICLQQLLHRQGRALRRPSAEELH